MAPTTKTITDDTTILVTRIYPVRVGELIDIAKNAAVQFALQQWAMWPTRRENPHPWGLPPVGRVRMMFAAEAMLARYQCSNEIFGLAIDWLERHEGFPDLSRRLTDHDGYGTIKYMVAGAFYAAFQAEWTRLREEDRRQSLERAAQVLDSCWAD